MTSERDKPIVLVTEHLDAEAQSYLAQRCDVIECGPEDPAWRERLTLAQGLVVRTYTIVNRTLLEAAPQLKVVGRAGAGVDNIDVAACRARGIEVVYRPEANTQAVVEYVVALIADALRPRVTLDAAVDKATWTRLRAETVGRRQMSELTLGILGLGRIGSRVAEVGRALGFTVIYSDLLEIPPERQFGATQVETEELFAQSDVLSVHVDGRTSNRHLVRESLLGCLKNDALLINTSRGFVVDEKAVAVCLGRNPEMRAFLDVHEVEPIEDANPLLGLPNAKLYPHLASRTEAAMKEMSWVVRDVVAVLEGGEVEFNCRLV